MANLSDNTCGISEKDIIENHFNQLEINLSNKKIAVTEAIKSVI